MAWSSPMTAVANTAFTAAQFNTYVRDNMLETAVAKASAAGGYFVGNGVNSLIERFWSTNSVMTNQSTASSSFTDLATSGPSVTVATSTRAIVMMTAQIHVNTATEYSVASFAISGDTTLAALDDNALSFQDGGSGNDVSASVVVPLTNLTAGNNTFTMKYRATGGTASFRRRRIIVLPY